MEQIILLLVLLIATPQVWFCTGTRSSVFQIEKVDPVLHELMETSDDDRTESIFVEFIHTPNSLLNSLNPSGFSTMEDMHGAYIQECKLMQRESQLEIKPYLEGNNIPFESFWATNQIYVPNANADTIRSLSSFDDVQNIRREEMFHINRPFHDGPVEERPLTKTNDVSINALEWNIEKVGAQNVWARQTKGSGCVVGMIDTGCRATHQEFSMPNGGSRVIGWYDAVNGKTTPYDDNGHGTHCAGTIAGSSGIGVAPESTIWACKACDSSGGCKENWITGCCQKMTQVKPQIVSNSWGGPPGSSTYTNLINSWIAMGMVVTFSNGNSGPNCQTAGSPADHPGVVSVGSTTQNNTLSEFSSRGQCTNGMGAPTLSAPGSKIRSSWTGSDSSYKTISGTSMACPHVSGAAALMKAANPSLTFDQVKSILTASCVNKGLADPKQSCGGTSFSNIPNNMYGHGLLNLGNAFQLLDQVKANEATNDAFTLFRTQNDITSIIKN